MSAPALTLRTCEDRQKEKADGHDGHVGDVCALGEAGEVDDRAGDFVNREARLEGKVAVGLDLIAGRRAGDSQST